MRDATPFASLNSLGQPQVNEARDAFDVFDSVDGLLAFENVGKVLDKLGFDEVGDFPLTRATCPQRRSPSRGCGERWLWCILQEIRGFLTKVALTLDAGFSIHFRVL